VRGDDDLGAGELEMMPILQPARLVAATEQMDRGMIDHQRPVCVRCGYDLSGVAGERCPSCPECGAALDAWRPFILEPWPEWWIVAARLCGANAALASAVAAMLIAGSSIEGPWAALTSVLLSPVWIWAAFWLPVQQARAICYASAAPPHLERTAIALGFGAIVVNVAFAVVVVRLAGWTARFS
jgi:hypothetical protein